MQSINQSNEKLLSLPELAGVDALVAMSPENFSYVGGTFILTIELLRPRHGYAMRSTRSVSSMRPRALAPNRGPSTRPGSKA